MKIDFDGMLRYEKVIAGVPHILFSDFNSTEGFLFRARVTTFGYEFLLDKEYPIYVGYLLPNGTIEPAADPRIPARTPVFSSPWTDLIA